VRKRAAGQTDLDELAIGDDAVLCAGKLVQRRV
jgi:hypothetical protein